MIALNDGDVELEKPKTKIVATIGPSSSRKTILKNIVRYASVIRINLAHGDFEEKEKLIDLVREVSAKMDSAVSLLADLPGPKIRLGTLKEPLNIKR